MQEVSGALGTVAIIVIGVLLLILAILAFLMPWFVYRTAKWTELGYRELKKFNDRVEGGG